MVADERVERVFPKDVGEPFKVDYLQRVPSGGPRPTGDERSCELERLVQHEECSGLCPPGTAWCSQCDGRTVDGA